MVAQLKKGVLEFCVLQIIEGDELYGYEIMKRVVELFPDTAEQTVYTVLRRLLFDGCTSCYAKDSAMGPPRKYYKITPAGREYLIQCRSDWEYIQAAVTRLLSESGAEKQ